MDFSDALFALSKLALIFSGVLVLLHYKVKLWLCIVSGSVLTALLSGLDVQSCWRVFSDVLIDKDFYFLVSMLCFILILSGVQEATGQNRRMVRALEQYLHNPRLRLIIFPAMVGLLPMPGGALFSCPMIKAVAEGTKVSNEQKSLINYWFRHIWELACPLYPGYMIVCALLNLPLTELWKYTFPLPFASLAIGWFFFMRPLTDDMVTRLNDDLSESIAAKNTEKGSLWAVIISALPIVIIIIGALIFSTVFSFFVPDISAKLGFSVAFIAAICTALYQGRHARTKSLSSIIFTPAIVKSILLVFSIYLFKETVGASGIVHDMASLAANNTLLVLTFIILPLTAGLLTGVMFGFVGLAFPVLLGIIEHSPMQEHLLPLIVLAMVVGNCGQMLSPVHVCLVVTNDFFSTNLSNLLRSLLKPAVSLSIFGSLWAIFLFFIL